jgi:hypothetical protein
MTALNRSERLLLWTSTAVVGVSGGAFAWMKYAMTGDDPYAVVNHPWQPALLKIHLLAGPVLVFALGLAFAKHILPGLTGDVPRRKRSGLTTWITVVPMVFTGYLVQTATVETWRRMLALAHLATGLVFLAGFAIHQRSAAERRARRIGDQGVGESAAPSPTSGATERRASSTNSM